MDDLKKMFEKLMVGTITRGVLWMLALATARFGLPVVGEEDAGRIASYVASAFFVILAMIWSKKKDNANKAMPPPTD